MNLLIRVHRSQSLSAAVQGVLFTAGYKWNSGTGEVQPYRTEYLGLDHAMGRDKKKGISCYRDADLSAIREAVYLVIDAATEFGKLIEALDALSTPEIKIPVSDGTEYPVEFLDGKIKIGCQEITKEQLQAIRVDKSKVHIAIIGLNDGNRGAVKAALIALGVETRSIYVDEYSGIRIEGRIVIGGESSEYYTGGQSPAKQVYDISTQFGAIVGALNQNPEMEFGDRSYKAVRQADGTVRVVSRNGTDMGVSITNELIDQILEVMQ